MNKKLRSNFILSAIIGLLILTSCGQRDDHADHANDRTNEKTEKTEEFTKLLKAPNEAVVASVKTIKGQYKSTPISLEAQVVVTYDTKNIYTIPSRVEGRIEKTYLKYAFQSVSKGQKVAEIYSPALVTAQRELIYLLENDAENKL